MTTWTDGQITRWMKDAEEDIVSQVYMRFHSFSIPIVQGQALYNFDYRIQKVHSILWKGKPLTPYIGREMAAQVPRFRELGGEPTSYQMHNDGVSTLRLIPVPSTSLDAATGDLYSHDTIRNHFIIRAFVFPDRSVDYFQIPDYLHRNLVKAYTLARAMHAEGIGQNLKAAEYWQQRYMQLVDQLAAIRARYYFTKERLDLEQDIITGQKKRLPYLPPDFVIRPRFPLILGVSSAMELVDAIDVFLANDESFLSAEVSDDLHEWLDAVETDAFDSELLLDTLDDLNLWQDVAIVVSQSIVDFAPHNLTSDTSNTRFNVRSTAVFSPPTGNGFRAFDGLTAAPWLPSVAGGQTLTLQLLDPERGTQISLHNLTSNTSASPFVVSASSIYSDTYNAFRAFNNNASQYWLGNNGGEDWLKVDFGEGTTHIVRSYWIRVNTVPEPDRAPKDWTLEGSNDDSSWDVIDTRSGVVNWESGETRIFGCAVQTTPYRYFRINITDNNGDATYTQIEEFFLFDTALSASYTKILHSYSVMAAVSGNRNPNAWVVEGFNETTWTWDELDTVSGQTGWSTNEVRNFNVTPTIPYRSFRLRVTANNGNTTWTEVNQMYYFTME